MGAPWILSAHAQSISEPEPKHAISARLVSDKTLLLGPMQIYGLMADLFSRSYFAELGGSSPWGPNHGNWSKLLPAFTAELLQMAEPTGNGVGFFLSSELAQRLGQEELMALSSGLREPQANEAIRRLESMGFSLLFLIQAQAPAKVPQLYSAEEHKTAKRTAEILRANIPEIEAMRPDLKALATLMDTNTFTNYQRALGAAFKASAGQLESNATKRTQFQAFLQRWRVKIRQA
jgi:hypothetical protein